MVRTVVSSTLEKLGRKGTLWLTRMASVSLACTSGEDNAPEETAQSDKMGRRTLLPLEISSRHLLLLLNLLLLLLLSGQMGIQRAFLLLLDSARAAAQRGRTQFVVLHEDKAGRSRDHNVSSEEFFAPGTRTASGDLKPRWNQSIQEDDSDCEYYESAQVRVHLVWSRRRSCEASAQVYTRMTSIYFQELETQAPIFQSRRTLPSCCTGGGEKTPFLRCS